MDWTKKGWTKTGWTKMNWTKSRSTVINYINYCLNATANLELAISFCLSNFSSYHWIYTYIMLLMNKISKNGFYLEPNEYRFQIEHKTG